MSLAVLRVDPVGRTRGHAGQGPEGVTAYTFGSEEKLVVTVWTYGASLVEVRGADHHGGSHNLVSRRDSLAEYENGPENSYPGATMGRYARCVASASFPLDGRTVTLSANDGRHHVHGGRIGFDRFVWAAEVVRSESAVGVRMRLDRPDGDEGYPGAVSASTTYWVHDDARLVIEHQAETSAPTIVAMTNHAFWNLWPASMIDEHVLQVGASRFLPLDEELIPRGEPRPVAGTVFDYRRPRRIGSAALDHCFLLDGPAGSASVHHPVSGRTLHLTTDQPGLQVYSGDGLAGRFRRVGLCLQTGALPNSPNRPDFPSSLLDPGEVYRHRTEYAFLLDDRVGDG